MIAALCNLAFGGSIVDATGVAVTAEPTDRLIVLSSGLTETVFALGRGDQVIAVDSTSLYPPAAAALPQVGYYRHLSAEGLISLRPDLVVAPQDVGPPEVLSQLRAAGLAVAVLSAEPSVDGARERILRLGELLDQPDVAADLVASLDRDLATVRRPDPAPRVLFVYASSTGALQVAGRDTAAQAMITLAGGVNAVDGYAGYRPLTAEGVVAARPDVILLTERGMQSVGGAEAVLAKPGVSLTSAGRARRVLAVDDLLLLGFGPRTGRGAALLASLLAASP